MTRVVRTLLALIAGVGLALAVPAVAVAADDVFTMGPASIDFGSVDVGTTTGYQAITVTNVSGDLGAFGYTQPAGSSGFEIDPSSPCLLQFVKAGGSCDFRVRFAPQKSGPASASISIFVGGSSEKHTTTLSGVGAAPTLGIDTAPATVDFGTVTYGTSAARTITVTNTGTGAEVVSAEIKNAAFADQWTITGCQGVTVAAGDHCDAEVTFTDGQIGSASATFVATATAVCQCPGTASASTALTASGAVAVQLSVAPSAPVYGQPITFTAVEAPDFGLADPTARMTFSLDGQPLGAPQPLDENGRASITTTDKPAVGHHTVSVVFSGQDAGPSVEQQQSFDVTAAGTSTSVTVAPPSPTALDAVTYTATVDPIPGGGTVTFAVDGQDVGGPVDVDPATGKASTTGPALPAGDHDVRATYSGDANHQGSASPIETFTVLVPTTTSLTAADTSVATGQPIVVTASVTAAAAGTHLTAAVAPAGDVRFFVDGAATPAATVSLDANGHATFRTSSLPVGRHRITATYGGAGDYAGSAAEPLTVTITAVTATGSSSSSSSAGGPASSAPAGSSATSSAAAAAAGNTANTGTPVRDELMLATLLAGGGAGILLAGRRRPRGAHRR